MTSALALMAMVAQSALKQLGCVRAVVVGDGLNALGLVRSLGAAGVPVTSAAMRAGSPPARSRFARFERLASKEGGALVDELLRIVAHDHEPPVVFLTEEASVISISAHRERLAGRVRLRLPPQQRVTALTHKAGFQHLAEALRAPIPPFVELRSRLDLPRLGKLKFPCVLKPAAKDYRYGARFKKAYVVGSPEEVARLYQEIEPVCPNMVVQQWIDGNDNDIFFCLQYAANTVDAPLASFTGRKIRAWPPHVGGTASCVAAPEVHAELSSVTAKFFRETGVVGMAGMEFKRDRRDGRFYMIEPTIGRTDFQHEVAVINGVNLPYLAYCFELGLPLPRVQQTVPRRVWREPLIDRWSAQTQGMAHESGFAGARVVDAWWRASDPLPWVDFMTRRLKARWSVLKR
ncbi:MAG: hypothetical protein RIR70_626 [Pseudomonadota bacterium]